MDETSTLAYDNDIPPLMQNDTNEFVFRKKRRRLRVNVQDVETDASLNQVNDGLNSALIPEIALSEPATSSPVLPEFSDPPTPKVSSENIITVEKFLRGSVQTHPKIVSGNTAPKGRAYMRQRQAGGRTSPTRKSIKVSKRPRGPSRIATTLLRASVLTDGDPLDILVDGAGIPATRRPLKFVPFIKFASSDPLRPSQTDSVEHSDVGCVGAAVPHTRHFGEMSSFKAHRHHLSSSRPRVPLCLVPFREAETAYTVMFP